MLFPKKDWHFLSEKTSWRYVSIVQPFFSLNTLKLSYHFKLLNIIGSFICVNA